MIVNLSNPADLLPVPPGWTKPEVELLPPRDHGYAAGYDHESGLALTFYQYTRGHKSIPDDIDSALLKEELRAAEDGIMQAVKAGHWQAAEKITSKTVELGNSKRKALWSQFHIKVDDVTVVSEIFVWARDNTFFKIRCTNHVPDKPLASATLDPMLTALGQQRPLKVPKE